MQQTSVPVVSKQTQTCSAQGSNGGLVPWVMVGPKIIVQNCTRPSSSTLFNPTKISFLFLYITLCSVEKMRQHKAAENKTKQLSAHLNRLFSWSQQTAFLFNRVQQRGRERGLEEDIVCADGDSVSSPTSHSEHICKEIVDN